MERLIAILGLTPADMAEILGYFMGFIMASVVIGHIVAWCMKEAFEMVCGFIYFIADLVMKHIKKRKNR